MAWEEEKEVNLFIAAAGPFKGFNGVRRKKEVNLVGPRGGDTQIMDE